jgi:hypothetical protein
LLKGRYVRNVREIRDRISKDCFGIRRTERGNKSNGNEVSWRKRSRKSVRTETHLQSDTPFPRELSTSGSPSSRAQRDLNEEEKRNATKSAGGRKGRRVQDRNPGAESIAPQLLVERMERNCEIIVQETVWVRWREFRKKRRSEDGMRRDEGERLSEGGG